MEISNLQQVVSINNQLGILWGRHPVKNLPNFRLAYAGEQYEKRRGTFNVYIDETDTFLRTETGIKEVKKYAYIDDDTWILERLIPNTMQDVAEGDYIYECFVSFKKVDHVPPLKACVFAINSLMVIGGTAPKTEKEALERENERMAKEKIKMREILDTKYDYTEVSMRLKHGAGVAGFHPKIQE